MSRVVVRGLSAGFDAHPVLQHVDLDVPDGATGAVVGPSGSGKTTLLRAIAGLHRPEAGSVQVGDQMLSRTGSESETVWVPPERRRIGLVPQAGSLFPHLTVAENVGFGLKRASLGREAPSRTERRRRVADLLVLSGLQTLADRMPHELSGGQAQRVALVRALAPAPAVVLFDEPFGALDANLREELRDEVVRILRATGATALLVTHDQAEALSFADRLFVLKDGVVAQAGRPQELYDAPGDAWVAGFLGVGTVLTVQSDGTAAETVWGRLEHQTMPPGPLQVLVRPEQVGVRRRAGDPGSDAGFEVVQHRYYGHDTVLVVRSAVDGSLLSARLDSGDTPDLGDRVDVLVSGPVRAFPTTPLAPRDVSNAPRDVTSGPRDVSNAPRDVTSDQ